MKTIKKHVSELEGGKQLHWVVAVAQGDSPDWCGSGSVQIGWHRGLRIEHFCA